MPDLEQFRPPSGTGDDAPGGVFQPPAWNWSKADDTGWWVRADWDNALLEGGRLRLDEWRRSGLLTTVKRGPHRVVYRADLAEGSVYVKHFLVPNLRAKARQWFRSGKGRNEGRRAAKLEAIGVPTITPVALGERRVRHFLLENLPGHQGNLEHPAARRVRRTPAPAHAAASARGGSGATSPGSSPTSRPGFTMPASSIRTSTPGTS